MRRLLSIAITGIVLTACGGGGGGGPTVSVPRDVDHSRSNPGATDLLDVWADPEPFARAFGLSSVPGAASAARTERFEALRAGQDAAGNSLTRLRNIKSSDLRVVGETDGITYARWMAGPAGGLDIDFDFLSAHGRHRTDLAPVAGLSARERAMVERAGKEWGYRLDDTIADTYRLAARHLDNFPDAHGNARTQDLQAKDVSIIVLTDGGALSSGGTWIKQVTGDAYKPRIATVHLTLRDREQGAQWFRYIAAHEIGHALGFTAYLHESVPDSILAYFDFENGTFNGPASVRANGGRPVPFQRLDADRNPVTSGGEIDYGHPAPCAAILSYCGDPVTTPHELDFALLDDIGFSIRPASVRDTPETYGYAGWGDWAAWGVGVDRLLRGTRDHLRASADAFGLAPDSPLASNDALSGEATWTGSLLGVDLSLAGDFAPVGGRAVLTVDMATLDGRAVFDNLRVGRRVGTEVETVPFRRSSLAYGISIDGNGFADEARHVRGGFFGPAHEEMAGTLEDRTPGVELLAGFGGKR